MGIKVNNEEMVTARELARLYSSLMDRIANGELEKIVVTRHGKMEAVLLTVEDFERLQRRERSK